MFICLIISVVSIGGAKLAADYVAEKGGVTIPVNYKYQIGTMLYFNLGNANGMKHCVSGFSICENEYTWTDGHEAVMMSEIDNLPDELTMRFTCYGESQNMNAYINDSL